MFTDPSLVSPRFVSSVILKTASLYRQFEAAGQRTALAPSMQASHASFQTGNTESPLVVTAVLDPLSDAGQRTSPVLLMLRDALGALIRVHFIPKSDVAELPIKSFYRFVGPKAQPLRNKLAAKTGAWRPVCVWVWGGSVT